MKIKLWREDELLQIDEYELDLKGKIMKHYKKDIRKRSGERKSEGVEEYRGKNTMPNKKL